MRPRRRQQAIALADGLVELPKHVTVGNLALVLPLAFGVLAAATQVECRLKSGSGRWRITAGPRAGSELPGAR